MSSRLPDDELEEFLRNFNEDLRADRDASTKFERWLFGALITLVALIVVAALSGCGGNAHDEEEAKPPCRRDFVGPPSPGDNRPLCPEFI